MVEANNIQETSIKVKTHKGFTTQVSLHSLVNDKASDNGLLLKITVCGLETLKATWTLPLKWKIVQKQVDEKIVVLDNKKINELFVYDQGKSAELCSND